MTTILLSNTFYSVLAILVALIVLSSYLTLKEFKIKRVFGTVSIASTVLFVALLAYHTYNFL